MSILKDISIDEIYWLIKLGKSKYKISANELIENINNYIKEPVFFLSTGRCGTKWFSELFKKNKQNAVFHQPIPTLDRQSPLIYQLIKNGSLNNEKIEDLIREMIFSGREQHFRYTYKTGKRYIETNNYITFFAPVLHTIFPDAKFVHLTRHPVPFIKSGINRSYYKAGSSDSRRITPVSGENIFDRYSQIQKIAWLWNETNLFIEEFANYSKANIFHFNFNNLTVDNVYTLSEFLNIDVEHKDIVKLIPQKINKQKSVSSSLNLNSDDMVAVDSICSSLMQKYNYKLG